MGRGFLLFALTLLAFVGAQGQAVVYVTAKDEQVAKDASDAVDKYCAAAKPVTDDAKNDGIESLEDALGGPGNNFILDAAKKAENEDEFEINMTSKVGSQVWPLFLAVVSFLLLICFNCSAAPFGKACRPCSGHHPSPLLLKFAFVVPVFVVFLTTCVGVSTSSAGASTMIDGMNTVACESAKLLNYSLSGKDTWIGILPAIRKMEGIDLALEDGSQFVTMSQQILGATVPVTVAIGKADLVLQAMTAFMQSAGQVAASSPSGVGSLHRNCTICGQMTTVLTGASQALNAGIGSALSDVRLEADAAFTKEKRLDSQYSFRNSTEKQRKMKDAIVDSVGAFTRPNDNPLGALKIFTPIVTVIFLGMFVALLCGGGSTGSLVVREKTSDGSYSTVPHRCGGCSWSCGLMVTLPALALGGIMIGLSIPLAAVCFILDDLDGEMLKEMGPGLGMNVSSVQGQSNINLVDHCVNPVNRSANPNMLNLMLWENETDGTNMTMMQKSLSSSSQVHPKFQALGLKLQTMNATLANSTPVLQLLGTIQLNPIDALIVPVQASMATDTSFAGLVTNTKLQNGLGTSLRCSNQTLVTNVTIPGLDAFFADYADLCNNSGASQNQTTACGPVPIFTTNAFPYCLSAAHYIQQVGKIHNDTIWKCTAWKNATGHDCDPDVMTATGFPCSSYTLQNCTYAQFVLDYNKFVTRIGYTFGVVDAAVNATKFHISDSLMKLVYGFILLPSNDLLTQQTCGWIPELWQGIVDGLCYQTVFGMRGIGKGYVLAGGFLFLFAIFMYVVWRRTIDNVNFSSETQIHVVN